jgi:hypothetical protein
MRYASGLAAKLRRMNAPRKLALVVCAAITALSLMAGPASGADSAAPSPAQLAAEEPPAADDDDHRISLVDTPRDRFGLLMLAVLFVGGGLALINARRQLRGERDQASGEFRWR